jgi:hypothetical protein
MWGNVTCISAKRKVWVTIVKQQTVEPFSGPSRNVAILVVHKKDVSEPFLATYPCTGSYSFVCLFDPTHSF